MRKLIAVCIVTLLLTAWNAIAQSGKEILDTTGVQGGLVVHVGCGDGKLTASLRANERYLVHGLDQDASKIEQARKHIESLKLYGPVSVARFDGKKLPYVRGLVNLLVASELGSVPMDEVLRVLAPEGVAYIQKNGKWEKTVKPRPDDIDEWTHFLHDASNDAVARDRQVGPPKGLRWLAGPKWCRSHEMPSSVGSVVTSGGRIFTILDEGPTGVFKKLPQKCMLVARDAFSGVLLWKHPLQRWQPQYGTGEGNRWNVHHTIARRLVAKGDRVYATLGFLDSPVSVLDAATGKILTQALERTKGTDELLLCEGVLIAKITKKRSVGATVKLTKEALNNTLAAIDVKTGKQLWRKEGTRVAPFALAAKGNRVLYHDMDGINCLELRTGKQLWRADHQMGVAAAGTSNLTISDGVFLFYGSKKTQKSTAADAPKAGGKNKKKKKGKGSSGAIYLTAFSMEDGKELWECRGKMAWAGACTQPADLFVIDGLVYCGTFQGKDLKTGEVKKTISVGKLISPGHHYRCHRSKATTRYMILPKRGAEFVDVEGDHHMRNDWLRAPCFAGATPANGLLYLPSDQCFCYPGVKFSGYFALSAEPTGKAKPSTADALERGPAYGKTGDGGQVSAQDWPMHRHDAQRSGSTKTEVPVELTRKWDVQLDADGSAPVIVGDQLWVAEKDAHRIRCLDANKGTDLWSYTAGGRISSTPTIHQGLVLFGCRDGYVYCLNAKDGALAWRFRAAPGIERLVSYEQVESVWPVHGSVLVKNDAVYFAAGRSSYLDGGIIVYGLEAKTGKVLCSHVLEGPWPDIKKDTGTPFAMEGSLNDLMVSDGKNIYLQRVKFDAQLKRQKAPQGSSLGELDMGANYLVATGGFLDDSGYDRIFWMYSHRWPGFYLAQYAPKAGQLVVFDESTTYAVKYFYRRHQWSPFFTPAEEGYLLFADDNDNQPGWLDKKKAPGGMLEWLPAGAKKDSHRRGGRGVEKGTGYVRYKPAKWKAMVPLRIRAMVLAGDKLFAAGPPDVVDAKDPLSAFEGRMSSELHVYSTADGKLLKKLPLSSPAAFDGMSAANGKLYLATKDGKVICLGK